MYAIFWTLPDGRTGNGEYILDEESLCAWLDSLRTKYPEMKHWGQLPNGERHSDPIPRKWHRSHWVPYAESPSSHHSRESAPSSKRA